MQVLETSRSSGNYDRTTKADTYLALGIRDMWLTDADNHLIEARHKVLNENLADWQVVQYGKGEHAESRVLAGWRASVDELFAGLI